MKKLFCITIIVVLLSCLAGGSAEITTASQAFSVRNGIVFGMTKEQVKEIEKNNEITSLKENEDYNSMDFYATVAGYDDCHVVYTFNENNVLGQISYTWGIPSEKPEEAQKVEACYNTTHNIFDTLAETLTSKYKLIGELENEKKYSFVDFGTLVNKCLFMEEQTGGILFNDYNVYGFKQYITPSESGYVEIGIVNEKRDVYLFGDLFNLSATCSIVYTYIPKEQYDAVLQEGNNRKQQRENDL